MFAMSYSTLIMPIFEMQRYHKSTLCVSSSEPDIYYAWRMRINAGLRSICFEKTFAEQLEL